MITYGDLDNIAKRKTGVSFTMVFDDGQELTSNLHENPEDTNETIIAGCNATNPEQWGKVVDVKDRKPCFYW